MMIRPYCSGDLEEIVKLFTNTIHLISRQYYTLSEINAWAPESPDMEAWARKLSDSYTLVFESDGIIKGFGSLIIDECIIDLLYTHHAFQGQGIATAIMDALEKEAVGKGCMQLRLTTSATAWSFYQNRGYCYKKSERRAYGEILFDCQILEKYLPVFPDVRRKDRLLDNQAVTGLLNTGNYGFLSLCAVNGYGYGIPVCYVYTGVYIYFHCALQGFKLENITKNNKVSFCVVGYTKTVSEKFSTEYESVLVFGKINSVTDEKERSEALGLLVGKYASAHIGISQKYIKNNFHRVHVLRLDIDHLSGKSNR